MPLGRSVVLMLTRMNRILEINLRDRMAVVEPGVVNVHLTRALAGHGLSLRARSVQPNGQPPSAATWPPTPADRTRSSTA